MLVSPGLEITVTDESQYVSTAVGTVPFMLLATAENKVFNGSIAPYTTPANANKLLAVTSQRDLITNFGYPDFKQSSAGTPLNGDELNEYGLMAAYSSLGVVNRMYIIRADIDLAQLTGTAVRPVGAPANGTFWLDLANTAWGVNEWSATTQGFSAKNPLVITNADQVIDIGGILYPVGEVGATGSYAVVVRSANNYMFYKTSTGWVQIGNTTWQNAWPALTGTITNTVSVPIVANIGDTFFVNNVKVTCTGTTLASVVADINSNVGHQAINGVTAAVVSDKITFYVTSASEADEFSNVVTGSMTLVNNAGSTFGNLGLTSNANVRIYSPTVSYGSYIQVPDWRTNDTAPRPSGSVWEKTSILGSGANMSFNMFDATNLVWTPMPAPVYSSEAEALYRYDLAGGGINIAPNTLFVQQDVLENGTVTLRPMMRETQGATVVSGTAPVTPMTFTPGNKFDLSVSAAGSEVLTKYTVTISANTSPQSFVSSVLNATIPFVTASLESTGAITFTHTQGGEIRMAANVGTPLTTAGFTSSTTGVRQALNGSTDLILSNFVPLVYTYSSAEPYTAPADGALWYWNSPLEVDIMVNDTTGWKGYKNVSRDARGYNLTQVDPAGPILAPIAPTTQSDNTALVAGDLWIDTGDLENFPVISRWSGSKWILVDNTDTITQNGIVFADARWDATGTLDPAAGNFETIATLLGSNYLDLDAPDYRLYPRGTLLFNLRRSGFNVKHYVSDYFNDVSFPDDTLPTVKATWVTSSGLQNDGSPYMGHKAQRNMVVKAMRGALDSNDIVREESFVFNLITSPGYPELISNMVMLNNDRKNTGFVIGDTPMSLPANIIEFTAWSNNTNGDGLATADPYLAVYYPSGSTNDLQGNPIIVPPSHMILRAAIKSDNVSYPWFAFAGTRRGAIDNATDIGYVDRLTGEFIRNGVNQGLRDALYQLNINPMTILPGVGLVNFGNKTRNGFASSMDRVNVARLVNYIRTILAHIGDGFLFEPNDAITRNQIKQIVSSAINDLIAKRGVYDYLVVCDETNNDSARIARNELYVDIAIEPMKTVEFIYIPIRLKNPGSIKNSGK